MKINLRVIISFILIWLAVSLALVVPTISIQVNPILTVQPQATPEVQMNNNTGSSAVLYALEILVWGIIGVSIIGALVYRRILAGEAFNLVISLALGFLLVAVVLLLGNRVNLTPHPGGISGGGGFSSTSLPGGSNLWVIVLIGLIFAGIIFMVIKTYRVEKVESIPLKSVKEYVEEAIYHVKIGKDVRGAILEAYMEMEKLMRARGVEDKKYYTPREFEDFALRTLKISKEPVKILTELFELARYSSHEMSEEHRKRALDALEAIRDEVEK